MDHELHDPFEPGTEISAEERLGHALIRATLKGLLGHFMPASLLPLSPLVAVPDPEC